MDFFRIRTGISMVSAHPGTKWAPGVFITQDLKTYVKFYITRLYKKLA